MMIYPPITELTKKTGSRYALVIETAKRARQIVEGSPALSDVKTSKDVTIAVNEIYEGKIEIVDEVLAAAEQMDEVEANVVAETEAETDVEAETEG